MHTDIPSSLVIVAPFLLLLFLWFICLRVFQTRADEKRKQFAETMKELIQTNVVPEFRALRESVEGLRADLRSMEDKRG
jgi:flagellar biosynthesis/type III secretory pathway M-ring protein FliF/YscJ